MYMYSSGMKFNWRFSHHFQCSLVGINFWARTVPHTFPEMFLQGLAD